MYTFIKPFLLSKPIKGGFIFQDAIPIFILSRKRNILDKLELKHHISQNEVEQVFASTLQYRFLEKGKIEGENIYSAYGQTDAGRYITIIFILKFKKCALIISARDMGPKGA